jgi:hypothetical protein
MLMRCSCRINEAMLAAAHIEQSRHSELSDAEIDDLLERFHEMNPSNYSHDDACEVNAWACEAYDYLKLCKFHGREDAEPVAWMIELQDSQYFVDSLDDPQAMDDLTNHGAKAVPLVRGEA